MSAVAETIKRTKVNYCLECGKCSSICPISLLNEEYTPRHLVRKAVMGDVEGVLKDGLLWSCLTCRMCNERCESGVLYAEFVRDIRIAARRVGEEGTHAHSGALQSLMRMMTSPELRQNRLDWVPRELKISNQGEALYFVGCLPYFDGFFTDLKLNTLQIAKDSIKILNYLGVEPVLMPNERCCGHDLLWTGDIENFKRLAQQNIEEIKRTGAKRLITSCPECYNTLKDQYPKYVGELGMEVIHVSEFLAGNINSITQETQRAQQLKVTYQDPCRLGRFSGIYEEPRKAITALRGVELREMERNRRDALCCGTSGWMNCGTYSKQIQLARLKEAKSTGADLLITSCPKCQIHFKCAMNDRSTPDEAKIEIQDLTTFIANRLKES